MVWCLAHLALLIASYTCHVAAGPGGTSYAEALLGVKGITLALFVITWPVLAFRALGDLGRPQAAVKWGRLAYVGLSGLFVVWFCFRLLRFLFPG